MQKKIQKRDQLYEALRSAITGGEYPLGSQLPKEIDFAEKLGVSRKTLRYALERLENDRLIERLRSKGTFIRFRHYLVLADNNQDIWMPFNYIIPSIIRTAERMGAAVSICAFSEFENMTREQVAASIVAQQNAGCIVITNNIDENTGIYRQLKNLPIPIVLAHGHPSDHSFTGWPTIAFDEREAWRAAFIHLKNQGHKRVAAGCQRPDRNIIRGWPQKDFLAMLAETGLEADPDLIFYMNVTGENTDQAMHRLFKEQKPPTAIVCYSDFWAPHIYNSLRKMNLRIPEDIAVMGFCGAPMGRYISPTLSTIDLQYEKTGELALRMLLEHTHPPLEVVDFKLEVRESTQKNRNYERYTEDTTEKQQSRSKNEPQTTNMERILK